MRKKRQIGRTQYRRAINCRATRRRHSQQHGATTPGDTRCMAFVVSGTNRQHSPAHVGEGAQAIEQAGCT